MVEGELVHQAVKVGEREREEPLDEGMSLFCRVNCSV